MEKAASKDKLGSSATPLKPIIKRSDEAILRRAEKRGRTFDEQFQVDLKKKKKNATSTEDEGGKGEGGGDPAKPKLLPANKTPKAPKAQPRGVEVVPAGDGKWVCGKCSNTNFPTRAECNRCQTVRFVPPCASAKAAPAALAHPDVGTRRPGWGTKPADAKAKAKRPPLALRTAAPVTSWNIKPPSAEELEENNILRRLGQEALSDPQLPEWLDLTDEERARARVLLDRSSRKANKRSKIKDALLGRKR